LGKNMETEKNVDTHVLWTLAQQPTEKNGHSFSLNPRLSMKFMELSNPLGIESRILPLLITVLPGKEKRGHPLSLNPGPRTKA
jgi:hypothetical protein